MLRKLLSVALTLTLVFMLAAPSAVALNTDIGSEIEIVGYNSSRLYTERTASWYLCIAAEPGKPIDVALSYANRPDYVYETKIDFNSITAGFASNAFWWEIKDQFFSEVQSLNSFRVSDRITTSKTYALRNTVTSTLLSKLNSYYGTPYSNKTIDSPPSYAPYSVKVTESLEFDAYLVSTLTWSTAMSIASFVVGCGLKGHCAELIADVLDVSSVSITIAAGTSVDSYRAIALFIRRGLVNNTPVVSATKTDIYYAFEQGAEISMSSYSDRDIIYAPHEYDYNTTELAQSAYETYLAIYG
jgi:hypothetical protein